MKKEQTLNLDEETTIVRQQTVQTQNPANAHKSKAWKSILIGGVPGIMLGTAGTAFAQEVVDSNSQEEGSDVITPDANGVEHYGTPSAAESVSDDMSFGEAFNAARMETGPGGVFTWHGNQYSTYTAEEWNAMSNEERQEFANNANDIMEGNEENEDDEEIEGNEEDNEENGPEDATVDNNNNDTADGEISVQIHEVGSITDENGEIVNVAIASVDGHDAALLDIDNDGYVDGVMVDANDDGTIQEDEVIETPESDIHMSDIAMMAEAPEDSIYEGMPDYTNDADISSLA